MRRNSRSRHPLAAAILAALLALGADAGRAWALGTAAPLDDWGNFGTETALCQRALGRAAALCAARVLQNRSACFGAEIAGASCDRAGADAALDAVRQRSLRLVEQYCDTPQLQNLRFVDRADAENQVSATCRDTQVATTSAIFAPAMVGDAVAQVSAADNACIQAAARAAAKLLRYSVRARQRALDQIAATDMQPADKQRALGRAQVIVDRIAARLRRGVALTCAENDFAVVYGRSIATFLDGIAGRGDCVAAAVYAVDGAGECPAPRCGNGIQEDGEECDDGNDFDGDACRGDCKRSECEAFASTYDLIQRAVFENRGCTEQLCHSSQAPAGGLDLTAGNSYANLIDVAATTVPGFKRIDPGNRESSLLWLNVAAKTFPEDFQAPVRAMPVGPNILSANEVEALRLWIESGGAARTGTVPGTAALLDACLPEPEPIAIEPLAPPAPDKGIQLHMPAWTLEPKSESEVCYTSYYDLTGQIPAQFLSPDGKSFRYRAVEIRQDPLSHHLIVDLFRGAQGPADPSWGPYYCNGGVRDGELCNPLDRGFCGAGDCATPPDPDAIACIGFGPLEGLSTLTGGGFAFAQETTALFTFPAGVYDEIPLKGNVLWNSHAFNLTKRRGKLEGWVNIYFPESGQQRLLQQQIFNTLKIFWDVPFVNISQPRELPPFGEHEICNVHVFGRSPEPFVGSALRANQSAHIFELSGHMHRHGKRFQIFRGMFLCDGGSNDGAACSPFQEEMCPAGTCRDAGGRAPQDALLYTNFIYNDPVVQRFPEPLVFTGTDPVVDRALTYCAHYDNGAADVAEVKRRSTSPPGGEIFPGFTLGGPCAVSKTHCIGGPNHGAPCGGNDDVCASSAGAGDGDCDACPLTGGFRTEDEMFILFGNYWVD